MENSYNRVIKYFSNILDCNLQKISNNITSIFCSNKISIKNDWQQPASIWLLKYNNKSIIISSQKYFNIIKQISIETDIFDINFLTNILDLTKLKTNNITKVFYFDKIINDESEYKLDFIKNLEINDLNYIKEYLENSETYRNLKNLYLEEIKKNINYSIYFGIFLNNKLISLITYPNNHYKEDKVLELGIETLKIYRNKGFGQILTKFVTYQLLKKGYIPICRTNNKNIYSQKILYKIGYKIFCEYITLI